MKLQSEKSSTRSTSSAVRGQRKKCLRKFLHHFPGGYNGKKYIAWERDYKWNAHEAWEERLNKKAFQELLADENFSEICRIATGLESKTNLLFSFEKMALRDAVKTEQSAKAFAEGLYDFVYVKKELQHRFIQFRDMLATLPVKQTRVLTWPLQTVFGFIADPSQHIFLKPMVTKKAAEKYGFDFIYQSKPNWQTYNSLLEFAALIKKDTAHLHPRDMIDIQSFMWVMGSEEYPD